MSVRTVRLPAPLSAPSTWTEGAAARSWHRDAVTAGLVGLAAGLLLAWALVLRHPLIGFDFQYFLPRLIDVRLHQLREGWFSVQWWTPSFGGGLPAFPNPQHTQFMLAQFLLPVLGPWGAAVAQAAIFNAAGAALVCWVCLRRFGHSIAASVLAAATFATSGFMWEHTLSGHMGFNVFPLVALIPEALHAEVRAPRGVALLGLGGAAIVFEGGYTIIIVFALSCLLLATLLPLARPADYRLKDVWLRLSLGAAAATAAAAAKVVAGLLFLSRFPRLADYHFGGSSGAEALSLFWQAFGRRSTFLLSRWLPFSDDEGAGLFGTGGDIGYGPVAALILLVGGVIVWRHSAVLASWRTRPALWMAAIAAVALTAEFALGRGLVWPWLKPLPLLRSLHENHRLAAAFALPLALAVAPCWDAVLRFAPASRRLVWAATALALAGTGWSVEYFFRNRGAFWYGSYDASVVARTWTELKSAPLERFTVTRIADVRDDEVFLQRASSLKPYEPIFGYGYGGAQLPHQFEAGAIEPLAENSTFWRFNDPRTFLRGSSSSAVTPLAATEEPALRALLAHRQPAWPWPALTTLAWAATGAAVVALILCLAFPSWPSLVRTPRAPPALPASP